MTKYVTKYLLYSPVHKYCCSKGLDLPRGYADISKILLLYDENDVFKKICAGMA